MYERIEKDIENKECKEIFENEREQGMKELERTIEGRIKKCEEQFSKDIKEDIEQFEERIKDSLVMLNHINIDSGFDPNFNIHSGIDKLGLFSSIGGLILLLTVPVLGEFALAAGIVLGVIGAVKSLWNFFDSDYKKSQQRKEVDKNLDKVCEKIEEKMRNQLKKFKRGIKKILKNCLILSRPVKNTAFILKSLSRKKLTARSKALLIKNSGWRWLEAFLKGRHL
ncbi:hypothetical protein BTM305_06960 [Helicobacter pylori]